MFLRWKLLSFPARNMNEAEKKSWSVNQLFFVNYNNLKHLAKDVVVTLYKDYQYNYRKNPLYVELKLARELQAITSIGFCHKVIPAPALFVAAEQEENQGAKRQQSGTYDKVLQVQYASTSTKGLEARPQIEAQNARNRQDNQCNAVYDTSLFSSPAVGINPVTDNILEYSNQGGKGSKAHKHEEQG